MKNQINFTDLPCDIKSLIYGINKKREEEEYKGITIKHLKGAIHIQPKIKHYNWLNCVSCGEDISKINVKHYHFCRKCYNKYVNPFTSTEVWRSRPMALDKNKMPIVLDDKLVLKQNARDLIRCNFLLVEDR